MAGLTTHVLDTAKGCPAAGLELELQVAKDGGWISVARAATNDDGRARLLEETEVATYRLTFNTGLYNAGGFYPVVTIDFIVSDPAQHYHVPLLLSPFGYATYRGS